MSSASSASTSGVSARAEKFVTSLCARLVAQLASANAVPLSTPAAIRAHLQSVFRSLPTDAAPAAALRAHLLEPKHLDAAVDRVAAALDKAKRVAAAATAPTTAVPTSDALFSEREYLAALAGIDRTIEEDAAVSTEGTRDVATLYTPLLLPFSSPAFVAHHLAHSLARNAASATSSQRTLAALALPFAASATSPAALLDHVESLFLLARQLPLQHSYLLPLTSLIDRIATRFIGVTLPTALLHRFQNLLAFLLLEEAKRRSRDQWTPEAVTKFTARVRTLLRRIGTTGYSGSLAGELMFLHHSFDALHAHKQAEKSVALTKSNSGASSKKRSRSRSPAAKSRDVPYFHAPAFLTVFNALTSDVVAQLATGARSEGAESEWLRFALLVRAVHDTPALTNGAFQPLKQSIVAFAASIPSLPVPLTLRPAVQDRCPGMPNQIAQMWAPTTSQAKTLKSSALEKILVGFEGDLTIVDRTRGFDGAEKDSDEDEVDASDAEDVAEHASSAAPAKKKSKKAMRAETSADAASDAFDSFGTARQPQALFFLDATGTGASVSETAADGDNAEGTAEEHEVSRSMNKSLSSIAPAPVTAAKKAKKGAKVKQAVEAESADEPMGEAITGEALVIDGEEPMETADDTADAANEAPEEPAAEENEADEEEAPAKSAPRKKATRAKKPVPAETEATTTRAKRERKPRKFDDA